MEILFLDSWLTFPMMASINTRIGWPGHYWEAGFLAFAGYLLVWLLVFVCLAVWFYQSNPAIKSFALLVVAAGILQYLPASGSGFQFLPCFPWLYSGLVPVVISVLTWLVWGLTMFGIFAVRDQQEPAILIFMIMGLVFNGLLSFWQIEIGTETPVTASAAQATPATISPTLTDSVVMPHAETAELDKRIAGWKKSKSKLGVLLTTLEEDRLTLLRQLHQKGVRSPSDGSSDPRAKVYLDELREVLKQQVLLQRKHDEFDLAILKSESRLRTIERRLAASDAGVNDPELKELTRSIIVLDESLATESETEVPRELDTLLEQQLNPDRLPEKAPQ